MALGLQVPVYKRQVKENLVGPGFRVSGVEGVKAIQAVGDIAGAVKGVGEQLFDAGIKKIEEDNEAAVMTAHNDAALLRMDYEKQFQELQGTDATPERAAAIQKEYLEAIKTMIKGDEKTPAMRQVVADRLNNQLIPQQLNNMRNTFDGHIAQQREIVANQTYESTLKLQAADMARLGVDGTDKHWMWLYSGSEAVGLNAVDIMAKHKGWTEEMVKAAKSDFISKSAYESVNSMLAAGKLDRAQYTIAQLEKNELMDQPTLDKLKKVVQVDTTNNEALIEVNNLLKKSKDGGLLSDDGFNLDYVSGLDKLRAWAGNDPEKLKAAMYHWDNAAQATERSENMYNAPFVDEALKFVFADGSNLNSPLLRKLYEKATDKGKVVIARAIENRELRYAHLAQDNDRILLDQFNTLPLSKRLDIANRRITWDSEGSFTNGGFAKYTAMLQALNEDSGIGAEEFKRQMSVHLAGASEQYKDTTKGKGKAALDEMLKWYYDYKVAYKTKPKEELLPVWTADAMRVVEEGIKLGKLKLTGDTYLWQEQAAQRRAGKPVPPPRGAPSKELPTRGDPTKSKKPIIKNGKVMVRVKDSSGNVGYVTEEDFKKNPKKYTEVK